jgi:hypothetical protein
MPETPEPYGLEDKRVPEKLGCPFRHFVMPGPLDGSLTWRDIPCLHAKCPLWSPPHQTCSIKLIPIILEAISIHLAEILDAMPDQP